ADAEGVLADDAALSLLAEAGDGSMRDALSIMDQAIASAPVEDGKARLDAGQIRDLMGTVPNAVFERIFEAVDGNRSAEVMTVANQLLDAGNSPAQLARQCVRYLRNVLVAKIAGLTPESAGEGVGNELLQISPDEQRRAARTAALFSEEELTRFLQVMLRTFDELGYRQEQRFHFELGLLKLVHLRRLLPIEEALSQAAPSGGSGRAPASAAAPRGATASASAARPAQSAASAQTQAARPSFSPFEQDSSRKDFSRRGPEASAPIHVSAVPAQPMTEVRGSNVVAMTPAVRTAAENVPIAVHTPMKLEEVAPQTRTAAPPEKIPAVNAIVTTSDDAQRAVVEALAAAKHGSAADAMADAVWTIADGAATIQTELSKTMLPMVMNAEAEKIVRNALRAAGIAKFTMLPGTNSSPNAAAATKKPKPVRSGSVHAKAMEHPMVQAAQKLFSAEVQTVIDLRED
ncbi:MAG TPA: hypothetical protein VN678_07150, partial [Acidobacteriaceae bacterium]|nr:hypothetical protein [Acidobacteriaceae bacterium]